MIKQKLTDQILFIAYSALLISIVFALRGITSSCIGLILVLSFVKNKMQRSHLFTKEILSPFFLACCFLFMLRGLSLLYTNHISQSLILLQRSSGLVLVPLAILQSKNFLDTNRYHQLMSVFIAVALVGSVYCIAVATQKYFSGDNYAVFFYHELMQPLHQHAIQFSILIFIALIYLFDVLKKTKQPKLVFCCIIYFSVFLFLLSSKLVLIFYIVWILFTPIKRVFQNSAKQKTVLYSLLGICFIALIAVKPVSNRFKDLFSGNIELFRQEKFNPGIYFNGLQFRLLQWRFVDELLNEHHAWLLGLSPGDTQFYLDKKYTTTNMYTGKPGTEDHGFLGYHTHNEFLQTLLETGIIGLLSFLIICFSLIKMAAGSKNKQLLWIVLLLLIYSFTDAVLETQYGLVIFTFFPLLLFCSNEKHLPKKEESFAQKIILVS